MEDFIVPAIISAIFSSTLAVFFFRVGESWWKAFIPLLDQWTFFRRAGLPGVLSLATVLPLLWVLWQVYSAGETGVPVDLPAVDIAMVVVGAAAGLCNIVAAFKFGWEFGWPAPFILLFIFCTPLWYLIAAPRRPAHDERPFTIRGLS